MIFAQMLEIVAPSDYASVLCARKFSFDPQLGFTRRRETSALRACLFSITFFPNNPYNPDKEVEIFDLDDIMLSTAHHVSRSVEGSQGEP